MTRLPPLIFVGAGDLGCEAVDWIRARLTDALGGAGWPEGLPRAWQFVRVGVPAASQTVESPATVLRIDEIQSALGSAHDEAWRSEAGLQMRRVAQLLGYGPSHWEPAPPVVLLIGSLTSAPDAEAIHRCLAVTDTLRLPSSTFIFAPEADEKPWMDTNSPMEALFGFCQISNRIWTTHTWPHPVFAVGQRDATDEPEGVPKILGHALAHIAMNPDLIQRLSHWGMVWRAASAQIGVPGLSAPGKQLDFGLFGGLGFSRLSVGRDFFDRYASDRLLRRAALRLLDGHLERRRADDASSDDELKQLVVQEAWPAFLRDVKLDEVREKNAISDRLDTWNQPELSGARAEFANLVREDVTADPRRGKVQNAQARANVVVRVNAARGANTGVATAIQKATNRLSLELQEDVQQTLERVILRSVAAYGLPVTIDLMDRLIDRSREGVESLAADRTYVGRKINDMLGALPTPPAGAPAEFPAGSVEDVEAIVSEAQDVLRKHVQVIALEISQGFLDDLTTNLLEPWRRALSDADGLLRLELRPAVGRSPLEIWPGDEGVPDYLRPSKVEFLLDEVDGFPEQFVSVIERSVSGDKGLAALITATEQVIAGEELGVHARTRPVALIEQRWVPKMEIARRKGQNQASARLSITLGLEDLKARTHEWLVDQEKYVGQFLQHSLGDYLTDPLTPAPERKNRQSRLVGHFESMVKASLPLVALEPAMTNLIHGHDVPPYNLHVSTLDVPSQLDDVRQQIKDAAVALLKTPQAVKFSNTPRQDAMMMTLLSEPYHLVEVASIMSPISKQWSKGGQGRELWQYRRARPLSEWVPLGPDARRALVTGWFAARLLGTASADGEGGTDLSVKVEGKTYKISKSGVRLPSRRDHVGMLLEALPATFLEAFNKKSLAELKPYQHLIELGASVDDEINPISTWLAGGKSAGAPELAGVLADGMSRQEAARMLVTKWRESYDRVFDPDAVAVQEALQTLADVVERFDREYPSDSIW